MKEFEFNLAIPADPSFADMIRDVVVHGARFVGSAEETALAFGCRVEDTLREMLAAATPDERLSVAVRRLGGPMEVVIAGDRGARTLTIGA